MKHSPLIKRILLDLARSKNPVPTKYRRYHPEGRLRGEKGAHFDDTRIVHQSSPSENSIDQDNMNLEKRKVWSGKIKEKIEVDKSNPIKVGKKTYYPQLVSIGDMKIQIYPNNDDNTLQYGLWEVHNSGGSSSLGGNNLGKYIRLRVIAKSQKLEASIASIDMKIRKLRDGLKKSPTYVKCRTGIEMEVQQIERMKKAIENYKLDNPNNFVIQVYEEDIKHRLQNIDEYYNKLNEEGSEYTQSLKEIDTLMRKKGQISSKMKSEIMNVIFEYLPEEQKRPIKIDQKEWASGPQLASLEQVEHFKSLISPFSPKGKAPLRLTLIVEPGTNRRSCHTFIGGSEPESNINLYGGDHLFNWVSIHEFGHAIEAQSSQISQNCYEFLEYRTHGDIERPLKEISEEYEDDEVYKKDEFTDPYCGKIYSKHDATELMSMGLQKIYEDPAKFAKEDMEYFDMIICSIYGEYWRPNGYY